MRYRVDDLAARSGVSVDTVRYYQSRGLLPSPDREGRVAWYSDDHLERVRRIRDLKDKGFTLTSIKRLVDGDLDAADEALVAAVVGREPAGTSRVLTKDDLARETGVSPALLDAIEREGLLVPSAGPDGPAYSDGDAAVVRAGLELLSAGLPLSELLALARGHDEAMRATAGRAINLFLEFVRGPIRDRASSDEDAAKELVTAFESMLSSTTELVGHHFRRVLLDAARARIESDDLTELEGAPSTSDGSPS